MRNLCLVLFFLLSACSDDSPFDAVSPSPVVLDPQNISTPQFHESVNYLSDDLKTIIFTRSTREFDESAIYSATFEQGKWNLPEKLPFSNSNYDAGFSLSPSNTSAFYTSKRDPNESMLSNEWNIWRVDYGSDHKWGEAVVVPPPLNSQGEECCLVINKDGQVFFSSNRDGSWDIYEAEFSRAGFSDIRKLSAIVNSENGEWPAFINEKGNLLIFSSIRKTGLGGDDLYFTRKSQGAWDAPILLDSRINTQSYEDSPLLSNNDEYFLYSSSRDTPFSKGVSNIYVVLASDYISE